MTSEIRKQDVVDQLIWDNSVNANDVFVNVQDGNVQLKGEVSTYSAKLAAAEDAYKVAGVRNVENLIEVKLPETTVLPNDDEITSNINKMLLWNSNIVSSDIKVITENRMVTLQGKVDTYWEKYQAENIANSANGVLGVINLLTVELSTSKVDEDIRNDIVSAFNRSVLIQEGEIDVSVNNGIVTLQGSVPNYAVKREATNVAMYTAGVLEVIDDLVIR